MMTTTISRLEYRYYGEAIPAPWQRNMTIVVDQERISWKVSCVDTMIARGTQSAPAGIMTQLAAWLDLAEIQVVDNKTRPVDKPPFVGTAKHQLTIYHGDQLALDACSGETGDRNSLTLTGEIDAFARQLTQMIPDQSARLPSL